ncbi:hypothetical protein GCM10028807_51010 [Spirosoma daeguense]
MKRILTVFLFLFVFGVVNAQNTGSVTLSFSNVVGQDNVVLKDKQFTTPNGEQFTITRLQYYVSNIRFVRKDGSEYVVPQDESYFLIRENVPATKQIRLNNIPVDTYTAVRFLIGVDSLRSTSDVGLRKGCLDVGGDGKDMYWAWNSGYIFIKLEGTSPQAPVTAQRPNHEFMYHIGLFGGMGARQTLNNLRTATVEFSNAMVQVKKGKGIAVGIRADLNQFFGGATSISFAQNPVVMASPFSQKIADNYQSMFSFAGILPNLDTSAPKSALEMN